MDVLELFKYLDEEVHCCRHGGATDIVAKITPEMIATMVAAQVQADAIDRLVEAVKDVGTEIDVVSTVLDSMLLQGGYNEVQTPVQSER